MRAIPSALLLAAVAAAAAQPSLRVRLLPAADPVWEGQRLRLQLEFAEGNARLNNLVPTGLPAGGDAPALVGPLERIASSARGVQAYAATVAFPAPGRVSFAPALVGDELVFPDAFLRLNPPTRKPFAVRDAPFDVVVRPLPAEGRPDGFCGAVGSFRLSASLDETACAPGDVVTLRWTLSGLGADAATNLPSYAPGSSFRVYPPRVERSGDGEIAVVQDFVPTAPSEGPLPPVSVDVFDVASGAWRTLSSEPLPLAVAEREAVPPPAEGPAAPPRAAPVAARAAPAETALVLFTVRPDAGLRVCGAWEDWVRVRRDDGASGWIPRSALPSPETAPKGTAP